MTRQRKGFGEFLYEDKPKKSESKKSESKKSKSGADDSRYVRLMEKYKRMRRTDKEAAAKIYKEAMKLQKEGDVSDKAVTAGAYI